MGDRALALGADVLAQNVHRIVDHQTDADGE
jgi:hypothetical protein